MKINSKRAFTLAEVLITLGIIGVVAAMTIPNLITGYQKKATVTKLQKAISTLNQAYKLSYDEFGDPEDAFSLGAEEYFNTYWAPFIKVLTYCSTPEVCGYSSNTPFTFIDGSKISTVLVSHSARTTFYTPDGFLYIIFTGGGDGNGNMVANKQVYVDINGGDKPNMMGKDLFILTRVDDKGILPYGYNASDSTNIKSCSRSNGSHCAERIKRAGWQIDKSYPWK